MIERFSTRTVPPPRRLEYWNQLLGDTYSGLNVDAMSSGLEADMKRWRLGDAIMIWPQSCGVTVTRHRQAAQQMAERRAVLHIAHREHASLVERGREISLRPGDMVLCAADDSYRWDATVRHEILIVELGWDTLAEQVDGMDDHIARVIPRELPTTRLLHSYILSLWREGGMDLSPALAVAYADSLNNMIGASLVGAAASAGVVRSMLDRMKSAITANAADPFFSPVALANELGVSIRTLQAAAAAAGTTPRHAIVDRRLLMAAEALTLRRAMPVTEIAFDCGFTDSGHFARRFRDKFGMSPSQYRQSN